MSRFKVGDLVCVSHPDPDSGISCILNGGKFILEIIRIEVQELFDPPQTVIFLNTKGLPGFRDEAVVFQWELETYDDIIKFNKEKRKT